MLGNYSTAVRPVSRPEDSVPVLLGAALQQIIDMDEKNQIITLNLWMRLQWTDASLHWDPAEFGDTSSMVVPIDSIWRPDIVLYTNGDSGFSGMMQTSATVTSEGVVYWNAPAIYKSTCKIDVTFFPFDEQHCDLKFGSWALSGDELSLTNRSTAGDISAYINNGEWELVGMPVTNNIVYYACCDSPYPDVTFKVIIRRLPLFYMFNLIGPCIIISVMTVLAFYLPADAGEKVTLGITVLLALVVFLLLAAETMPPTSEVVPIVGQYFAATIVLVTVSIFLTVYILSLHYRLPGTRPVPKYLKRITLVYLARILCLNNVGTKNSVEQEPQKFEDDVIENNHTDQPKMMTNGSEGKKLSPLKPLPTLIDRQNLKNKFEDNLSSIRTNLSFLTKRAKDADDEEEIMNEWKHVAHVLDRLLLWLFLFLTIIVTAIILGQKKPYTLVE
ncbi:putative neuronal acetylcholine receptor subunit alpha-10 [Apostichopus japonicus]|uniref:Putative neuronal acetylcholine receptor subunit alpha-10 n=1 Tax=Stichopus japonicus TaxID=307972 RepID=A0A2G8K2B7_STIJA|nr:putative neuronal acetylcholine receptor subunit alpha-10 [Apostichopus japonicus]